MSNRLFVIADIDSGLNYVQESCAAEYAALQQEFKKLESRHKDDHTLRFAKKIALHYAILRTFSVSGNDAIIETTINDYLTIDKYLTNKKHIHINGKYIVVNDRCFEHCPNLESIIFEEGVVDIKEQVLSGCSTLKSVHFPSTLNYIGMGAFRDCPHLEEVTFSNPRTWISPNAFEGTAWFLSFTGDFIIINSQLVKYNGKDETVIIPNDVIDISHNVFYGNKRIKSVVCPATLKHIWTYAFAHCENLEEIILNEGLEIINIGAFEGCTNLKAVTMPYSLEQIGCEAFSRETMIFYHSGHPLGEFIQKKPPQMQTTGLTKKGENI